MQIYTHHALMYSYPYNPFSFMMKITSILRSALCGITLYSSILGAMATSKQRPMILKYDRPAYTWMTQALPIGNGELGAMFMGDPREEVIQFNEKTLWTGNPNIRGAYQNFGYITLTTSAADYTDYSRTLSLDEALGQVSYRANGIRYSREFLASHPARVIAVRLTSDASHGALNFGLRLRSAQPQATSQPIQISSEKTARLHFSGTLDLVSYAATLQVEIHGGSLSTSTEDSSLLVIKDAQEVVLYLSASTNYDIHSESYIHGDLTSIRKQQESRIRSASLLGYEALRSQHIADYQRLYSRVKLYLGNNTDIDPLTLTTDELVRRQHQQNYLDELYYQYGRYLMIASSRGMDLPNNLQGIWNDSNTPPWESDIHTNINIQMNYWPSEVANLSECHLPFLRYLSVESVKPNGGMRRTAQNEGLRGWSVHTQSNIFSQTDWNINRPANAWYCMHLWQHYRYTLDKEYLRTIALPAMKSAVEYWFDRLKQDKNGMWIAPEEWSPEHGPWEDGIPYAQQLIYELFDATLQASKVVKLPRHFVHELENKFAKLDRGLSIGSWGQIKEWKIKEDDPKDEHRHLSHLIALYPGRQLSAVEPSPLLQAARTSLEARGENGTGWSRAWKIALWARLREGEKARTLLKQALNYTTYTGLSMNVRDGGVYENLFDAHPPFQIDGNFGATAGISEMLLQSYRGELDLLPALPKAWHSGSISGLKAEGGFTIDLDWQAGNLTTAQIASQTSGICQIRIGESTTLRRIEDSKGQAIKFKFLSSNVVRFLTKANESYTLSFE